MHEGCSCQGTKPDVHLKFMQRQSSTLGSMEGNNGNVFAIFRVDDRYNTKPSTVPSDRSVNERLR